MPMEIDRKQLKQQARQAMSLTRPSFWVVTLVYVLMTTGLSTLADFVPGELMALFISLAVTMYCWVVGFSYRLWSLWTCRRLDPGLGSLMEGFSIAGRVVLLELSLYVRAIGWTILLAFPASLLVLPLAMGSETVLIGASVCLGLFLAAALEIILLRYSMAHYVLADYPDLGPGVALAHSIRLTRGWRMELVKLYLSFFGWYALSYLLSFLGMAAGMLLLGEGALPSGLPLDQLAPYLQQLLYTPQVSILSNLLALPVTLYLTPYVNVTLAQFYDARIHLTDNMADPLGRTMPL